MNPYAFKTTDYGKSWMPIIAADSSVRGYAPVVKEDTVSPNLLFLGTEFGLWVSLDGGKHWAQYKGHNFPNVAVCDMVLQPRDSDLVIATRGRGIWIIDDITPLRHLTPDVIAKEAVFLPGRPAQQRISTFGGWAEGSAAFSGPNPPNGAWITYYQAKRHIFGRMKLEVFDSDGKLIDTLPSNNRRGISRVVWRMNLKAPHVPPAATAAFEASEGPRVVPGTYTVKMTRGSETYTEKIDVGLDARAKYTLEDRKANFDATMRVYNLLGDMSYDVERINGVRLALQDRASRLMKDAALAKQLQDLSEKIDDIRKKIVATKEGGAVTGEERIREKTTDLYGDLSIYEGRPAEYQVARIDSLKKELGDVDAVFDALMAKELPTVNKELAKKKLPAIQPITRKDWDASNNADDAAPTKPGAEGFWERD
jgi:hypothetical protein